MSEPAAFKAEYADWKLIKSRRVVQIVLEIPLEEANAAHTILGGMPNPAESLWLGVARIDPRAGAEPTIRDRVPSGIPDTEASRPNSEFDSRDGGHPKKSWSSMSPAQQAGMRCEKPLFQQFLSEKLKRSVVSAEEAAEAVRRFCVVSSRSDIKPHQLSGRLWKQLDDEFMTWMHHPEMVLP